MKIHSCPHIPFCRKTHMTSICCLESQFKGFILLCDMRYHSSSICRTQIALTFHRWNWMCFSVRQPCSKTCRLGEVLLHLPRTSCRAADNPGSALYVLDSTLGYQFRGKMPHLLTPMLATMSFLSNPKDLSGSVCALQLSVGHRGSQPAVMETVSCQAFPRNGTLSCQHCDCVASSAYLKYHS